MIDQIIDRYIENETEINQWLNTLAPQNDLPIYSSVDIRDSSIKMSSIDTNLFPAGFNNLCRFSIQRAHTIFKEAILSKKNTCKHILIICEEHTRNKWYLENIYNIKFIAEKAGFKITIATFMKDSLKDLIDDQIDVVSQLNNPLTIHRLRPIINDIKSKNSDIDLILLNNDLSDGIPEELLESDIPIFPSPCVGWHNRKKSKHFKYFNTICEQLCLKLDPSGSLDPWFISTLFEEVDTIDINDENDRSNLYEKAKLLFEKIQKKHDRYQIKEAPYIFIKANSGTYGMGVLPIYKPEELLELNRKARNKLYKGKGAVPITGFILQEGISSTLKIHEKTAELVMYSINNTCIGSFYRVNSAKNHADNLNSTGMYFERVCAKKENTPLPEGQYDAEKNCGTVLNKKAQKSYDLIAKIAGIATVHEKET